ncbi:protein ecdysoneless homolog [Takifugu flavidus]|uniref:protein ecdysoneless homolog n=1 Tax=Takifugu flavidus TaxID=433684 RepID=UPI0025443541|nr:protein ecdysoneless homolog [Takifugu flavidus]XP_056902713.1 protein ecdysoneless homolog [Takifugu flavidus]
MDFLQRTVVVEDMVQYKLFLLQPDGSDVTEERLTHLAEEILVKFAPLLVQYIWQNQPFNLTYHSEKGGVPAHIGGSTQFGENVEDEWFIVYLLLQITEAFPELAARVEDNDGEFLLIEAADYLPKWLNPDSSQNRVFLHRGEVHILPCPSKFSTVGFSKDVVPSLSQALAELCSHPHVCQASPKICSALKKRLKGYPEKIKTGLHQAHCFIPAGIAMVLAQRPQLVAHAVSAFYLRDPVDLQACRSFKIFSPETRVLTSVTFTRCLYAQLLQQQFTSDRRSGFTLPPHSHPQYRAHELGMKLAHGFEILCSRVRLPSSEPDAPISCNPQWKRFLESLKKNDYFQGELEGSTRYRELMRSAEHFFKQSVAFESSALSPGEEILLLMQNGHPLNLEELKEREQQLPQEDDDSWLEITAQDLDHLLQERTGGRADAASQNCSLTQPTQQLEGTEERKGEMEHIKNEECGYSLIAVSQGMKKFLDTMSSHEGAEVPWDSSRQSFNFDPNSMASALERLLGNEMEELDSDDLDDDDESDKEREEETSGDTEQNGTETLNDLRSYMDQMDEELMSTKIGQSFTVTNSKKTDLDNSSPHLPVNSPPTQGGSEQNEEEIRPLDLDVNLVTNLLESLSCQAGLAGPASNLLQSLGINLPANSDPS